MILDKTVILKPMGQSMTYYQDKGYDVKWREELEIKVQDLPDNSNVRIHVKCDNPECGHKQYIHYSKYTKNTKQNNGYYYCKDCWSKRLPDRINELYGVDNISKLDYIKQQKKNTCFKHYGVENYLQSEELREKMYDTCEEKYGTRNVAELESVKEKHRITCINKYGYDNPLKCPEIAKKARNTVMNKYGVYNISQSPKIRKKIANTMMKNQTVATSQQQLYLHNLYGGILNGVVSYFNCDIVFYNKNIVIEYDGGGHFLSMIFDGITEKEFQQKEIKRDKIIKQEGYKQIRIISRHDKLPTDEILLAMLHAAEQYFQQTEHTWIEYDIDNQIVRNALNKEGVFFDYGELRTIKKENVA